MFCLLQVYVYPISGKHLLLFYINIALGRNVNKLTCQMENGNIIDRYLAGLLPHLAEEDKQSLSYTSGATAGQLTALKNHFPDCPDLMKMHFFRTRIFTMPVLSFPVTTQSRQMC